jgi:ParB family chromosome partitioning protein
MRPRYDVLPLDQIDRDPRQPRKHFDEAKLAELAALIAELGVLEPILVRPADEGRYLIVAGERRWRAARLADVTDIPSIVFDGLTDDVEAFEASVAENVNRADMTIMEEVAAYGFLHAAGRDVATIAKRFGKSTEYVHWRMGLLTLREDFWPLVDAGALKITPAYYIAQLSPASQRHAVARYVRGDFPTETDAVDFARALKLGEQQTAFWPDDRTPEQVEQQRRRRKETRHAIERLYGVSALLADIAILRPEDLASALSGELGLHAERFEAVYQQMLRARRTMRRAKALSLATARLEDARGDTPTT